MRGGDRSDVIVELGESLEAVCASRNRSMAAIGGRNVMKVLSVEDDKFTVLIDLRKARKVNLHTNFSGGLAWSPLREGLIASTTTSGSVLLWDLEGSNYEHQYRSHKKVATKVCFSEHNENVLLSGSREGIALLYDLRAAEPVATFMANDTVRDLQFCADPSNQDMFVMADDAGAVRFYDIRRPERAAREFMAHTSQSASSIALNPHSKNLIATGGRDRMIRVWDWSDPSPRASYAVETWAAVTRVSWCPVTGNGTDGSSVWRIASCLATADNSVHVWDIRRPYLPYASFGKHTEAVTDFIWHRSGNGEKFLSCGKDGRVVLHFVENASHPIRYANTVAIDCDPASDDMMVSVPSAASDESSFRSEAPSAVYNARPLHPFFTRIKTIAQLARSYKLVGGSVDELCDWNARVAETLQQEELAYSWRILALLCSQTDISSSRPTLHSGRSGTSGPSGVTSQYPYPDQKKSSDTNGIFIGHDSGDEQRTGVLASGSLSQALQNGLSTNSDFFFGVEELNLEGMYGLERSGLLPLPSKRSVIQYADLNTGIREEALDFRRQQPPATPAQGHDSNATESEEETDEGAVDLAGEDFQSSSDSETSESSAGMSRDEGDLELSHGCILPIPWDPVPRIKSTLDHYSALGDVQTCAVVCMVLGSRLVDSKIYRPQQIDSWLYGYLELLERLRLWNQTAVLLKASYRPKLAQLSNESTFVKTMCPHCKTPALRPSARCRGCGRIRAARCCICDQLTRGVWSSCSACGHGGHLEHMTEWFARFNFCPFPACQCRICQRVVKEERR